MGFDTDNIKNPSGDVLTLRARTAIDVLRGGLLLAGRDHKLARGVRVGTFGTLKTSDDSLAWYDIAEGAAVDTNKWLQTNGTYTIVQTAAAGVTFNAGASAASAVFALHISERHFPLIPLVPLHAYFRARHVHQTNSRGEWGFGAPSGVVVAVPNGAFFRRKSAGTLHGVISSNGTEIESAAFAAVPANTDYAVYEILFEHNRATFSVYSDAGVLLGEEIVELTATLAMRSAVTHIPSFYRLYAEGSAPPAAPQLMMAGVAVVQKDSLTQKGWRDIVACMGYDGSTSPTAYTQLANYANNAAPTSATLSNTAAGYTNLGGQFQWAAVTGAETDYALFGWQNPSPYTFVCTGIKIDTWNMGAAAAATPTLLQWGMGFNSSAVSLATGAPYTPMRVTIGQQQLVASAAIGIQFSPPVVWTPGTPKVVRPGRFLHVILKSLVSAATASEIIRGTCVIDGYFE